MDVPILNTQTRKTKIRKFGIIIDLGKNPGPQHLAEIFFFEITKCGNSESLLL